MECVVIVAQNPGDGRVLAISRKNNPTKFGFIGGKIDPGETAKEAASREFFEETGFEFPIFLVDTGFVKNDEYGNTTRAFLALFFEGDIVWDHIEEEFISPEGTTIRQLTPDEMCDPTITAFPEYNNAFFSTFQ